MVPALIAVRNRAQTIVCAANLRNYGSALHMYAQSNDEKAPFATSWFYSQKTISNDEPRRRCPRGCKWHYDVNEPDGSLWPYLKDKNVHMCPTFRRYARQAECPNPSHSNAIPYNPMYSYSMNYFLGFDWATGLRISFSTAYEREVSLKLTRVTRPAKCFAFSEENLWVINTDVRDGLRKKLSVNLFVLHRRFSRSLWCSYSDIVCR